MNNRQGVKKEMGEEGGEKLVNDREKGVKRTKGGRGK